MYGCNSTCDCSIGIYSRLMPKNMLDSMPNVTVKFDTDEEKELFEFYPDEIPFTESESICMTGIVSYIDHF